MNDEPQPRIPEQPKYESARDVIPVLDKLKELKSFWRTRQAVLGGEALHELTKDELKQRELMGPWKFNIVQSTLSALPSVAIAFGNFLRKAPSAPPLFPALPEFDTVYGVLEPFLIPFVLLLTAFAIGRTIKREPDAGLDIGAARHRLSRHYLYLDATYGLFSQALASLYPSIAEWFPYPSLLLVWQGVITFRLLPMDLYAHGEAFNQSTQLFKPDPKSLVPWGRYLTTVLIVLPLLTIGLLAGAILLALSISAGIHAWRG